MFTFEDLGNLPAGGRRSATPTSARWRAGAEGRAGRSLKQLFFGAMTGNASKLLREDAWRAWAQCVRATARKPSRRWCAWPRTWRRTAADPARRSPKSDDEPSKERYPIGIRPCHVERYGFDRIFAVPPGQGARSDPTRARSDTARRAPLLLGSNGIGPRPRPRARL